MNQAHTLFRGEKCGLWLNFEGISSYSRGEWPIVLLHRTQRASRIPYSIANGVYKDSVMNWPADILYELCNAVQSTLLLIRGKMFTLFYFCRVTTQWYLGQQFEEDKKVLSVEHVLVNSTKVPLEGPPRRLGWRLCHCLKCGKTFLHGGGRRKIVVKLTSKKVTARVSWSQRSIFQEQEKETLTKRSKWRLKGLSAQSICKGSELIPGEGSFSVSNYILNVLRRT